MSILTSAKPAVSLNLSGLAFAPMDQIATLLESLGPQPTPKEARAFTALLSDRTLDLVRRAPRDEIAAASHALNRFLTGASGLALKDKTPGLHGQWRGFAELLSNAAEKRNRAAADAILLSSGKRGRQVLEILAESPDPVPRRTIRSRLGEFDESHLSHVLRELEEADLIIRSQPDGSKEVMVELGPTGREVVDQSVLPKWIAAFADECARRASALRATATNALVARLVEAGAPSALAAKRLVEAVAPMPMLVVAENPAPAYGADRRRRLAEAGRRFNENEERRGAKVIPFRASMAVRLDERPRAAFGGGAL